MGVLEIIFWVALFIVFYTYVGYGILLYVLVRVKELIARPKPYVLPTELPRVTLLIAAYNEQDMVKEKMVNTLGLDYPRDLLDIVWVTDGTTDSTNEMLASYDSVRVLFEPTRRGKSAAVNRAMAFIHTPIVVFTDANTMVCAAAIERIVARFVDPKVGCVAGEKRVASVQGSEDATAGEGFYWKYESKLKAWDDRLYSAVGAAGELFAVRRELYIELPHDTLLDDFVMSMKIAARGHRIAYCSDAYALENPSSDITQEAKRKVRIAAGGLQSIARLPELLNVFRYGVLSFQYVSHRVLRWSVTAVLLFALLPINVALVASTGVCSLYCAILGLQVLFYVLGVWGYVLNNRKVKSKLLFIPYYFLFMNVCVMRGFSYLRKHRGTGVWEKAARKQ